MVAIFLLLSLILRALEFVILIWVLMSWLQVHNNLRWVNFWA